MDPFEYFVSPHGSVFIDVLPAVDHRDGPRPMIKVSTGDGSVHFGHRAYKIDEFYMLTARSDYPWFCDSRHYGESMLRNANGNPIDSKSPMRAKLHTLVANARQAFIEEYPNWERESLRLAVVKKHSDAAGEAFRLRQQLSELEALMSSYEKTLTEWEA